MSAPEKGAGNLPEMVLFKGSFSEKSHDTCWRIWWMFIQKCLEQSSEHKTVGCTAQICSRGERDTLCVSSQVGCRLGCRFCATGRREVALGTGMDQIISCWVNEKGKVWANINRIGR